MTNESNPTMPPDEPLMSGGDPAPVLPSDGRVAELEADVARFKDQALRAMAEAENTRRRAQREIEDSAKFSVSNFARDLLPVADNLRRALDGITPDARKADDKLDKFCAGMELTERELLTVLERYNVRRVDPLGQPFDHNLHQAIMQVDGGDKPAGTVMQVLQAGFTIHDRLLRPALVAVSKGTTPGGAGVTVDTTA
jgi:molecular chaperone GrpE